MSNKYQANATVTFELNGEHKGLTSDFINYMLSRHDNEIFNRMESGDIDWSYGKADEFGVEELQLIFHYDVDSNLEQLLKDVFTSIDYKKENESFAESNGLDGVTYSEDAFSFRQVKNVDFN